MTGWPYRRRDTSPPALRRPVTMLSALAVFIALGGSAVGQSAKDPAVPTSGRSGVSCVTNRLASLGGGHGNATAVSRTGIAVGITDDARLQSHPVMWRDGRVTRIRTKLVGALPVAVNKHGVVVGTGFDRRSQLPVGWYWDGRVRLLPTDQGDTAFPSAIDDAGRVVGAVASDEDHADGNVVDDVERAVYWPSVRSLPRLLGPLAGDEGAHAFAIRGKKIGGVSAGDTFTPVVWDLAGRPTALRSHGGGAVHAFTSSGRPAGEAVLGGVGLRAVIWNRAGRPRQLAGVGVGSESTVTSAAADLLTGTRRDRSAGPGGRQTAMVWRGKKKFTLQPLQTLRPGRGPALRGVGAVGAAASVTAKGTAIVGYSTSADGSRFPTAWRCGS